MDARPFVRRYLTPRHLSGTSSRPGQGGLIVVNRDAGPRRSLPSPEDVFVAWLLWLPDDADIAAMAAVEIAEIDRAGPLTPELVRLRAYLLAALEDAGKNHPQRRRCRHAHDALRVKAAKTV